MSRMARAVLIALILANVGVLLVCRSATRSGYDRATIERLVSRWDISDQEHTVSRIAWVPTLTEALATGRRSNRPIVVITSNGDICSGRL